MHNQEQGYLNTHGIPYDEIDGADEENKEVRDALFQFACIAFVDSFL